MNRRHLLASLALGFALPAARANPDGPAVVVIGHSSVPRVDAATVARLYTGRAVEAGNVVVQVLNLPAGHALRQRFLSAFVLMDEERYRAYWTVRRHIGKGVPPREVDHPSALIDLVASTPGMVGYCDAAVIKPGMNVICRI